MSDSPSNAKHSTRNINFWAILWAIFPPILIFALFWAIIRPAIKGKEPNGVFYILWILGLICLGSILQLPFGSIDSVAQALTEPDVCRAILIVDGFATVICILLIVFTFRKNIPNTYIPIKEFKIDRTVAILWLLSLLPLLNLISDKPFFSNPNDIVHPVLAAFAVSLKNGSILPTTIGFLSVGLFSPVLEEIIFRGLLLESSHEEKRSKDMQYALDILVCVFFAILHLPISFFVPLIIAAALIYVRRHTGSLLPCICMHASWNCSILIAILVAR